jgi:hypothetical protein
VRLPVSFVVANAKSAENARDNFLCALSELPRIGILTFSSENKRVFEDSQGENQSRRCQA